MYSATLLRACRPGKDRARREDVTPRSAGAGARGEGDLSRQGRRQADREGVRPAGQGVRPAGQGVRPTGEGPRPTSEGPRPIGKGVWPTREVLRPTDPCDEDLQAGSSGNGVRLSGSRRGTGTSASRRRDSRGRGKQPCVNALRPCACRQYRLPLDVGRMTERLRVSPAVVQHATAG